uniref:Uncharacterized protein n=1 Tax=Heterorhabditis bacteriophora TaxID=37862 RepID=A0A1I7WQC8_HETBA
MRRNNTVRCSTIYVINPTDTRTRVTQDPKPHHELVMANQTRGRCDSGLCLILTEVSRFADSMHSKPQRFIKEVRKTLCFLAETT